MGLYSLDPLFSGLITGGGGGLYPGEGAYNREDISVIILMGL